MRCAPFPAPSIPAGRSAGRRARHRIPAWLALLLVVLPAGAAGQADSAGVAEPEPGRRVHPRVVFDAVAVAWEAADHAALAEMVAPEGVRIAIAPQPERETDYSPSQAFYFFKSLFRSTRTDSFAFRRIRKEAGGGLVHAVADWSYRRAGGETPVQDRLFFTLTQGRSGWGLSEIRAVR
jgi:hypothetical protein